MVVFGIFFLPIFPCKFGENEKLQKLRKTLLGNIDWHNISKKFHISSKTHWDMASGTIPKTRFIAIWPEFFWFLKFVSTWSMGHKIEACDHLSSYITIFTQINLSSTLYMHKAHVQPVQRPLCCPTIWPCACVSAVVPRVFYGRFSPFLYML